MSIEWDEKYELGLPEVDAQHQGLFDCANNILSAKKEDLPSYIMELYTYTRRHFNAEEEFLKSVNYPALLDHNKLHIELIDDLNREVELGFENDADLERFKLFFMQWLVKHILQEDVKYLPHVNKA